MQIYLFYHSLLSIAVGNAFFITACFSSTALRNAQFRDAFTEDGTVMKRLFKAEETHFIEAGHIVVGRSATHSYVMKRFKVRTSHVLPPSKLFTSVSFVRISIVCDNQAYGYRIFSEKLVRLSADLLSTLSCN